MLYRTVLVWSALAWIDAAILDIDLRGEQVYPLAEALRTRGVPFLVLTGYGHLVIPEPWQEASRVEKPFEASTLLKALRAILAGVPLQPAGPMRRPGRPRRCFVRHGNRSGTVGT